MIASQVVALGLTMSLVAYLGSRVQELESRVDELQTVAPTSSSASVARGVPTRRGAGPAASRRQVTKVIRTASPDADSVDDGSVMSTIDDHLWSDGGRQAIGDVVEERQEADRERRSERWKRMAEYRTQKAVDAVSEKLELSEQETEEVSTLVASYMEVRSSRWRRMGSDEDIDIAEVEREYEANKAEVEREISDVIGEDGLELLREEIRSGWR